MALLLSFWLASEARSAELLPVPASPAAVEIPAASPVVEPPSLAEPERTDWLDRLEPARLETAEAAERLLAAREKGVRIRQVLSSKDTKTITEYDGVPARVRPIEAAGRIFRHWIRTDAALQEILRTGVLRPGPVPYVDFTGTSRAFIKGIYPDVRGVFFTTPDQPSSEPRIMNEPVPHYVDFRLPEGISAVDLDLGAVLMVPAENAVPVQIEASSLPKP